MRDSVAIASEGGERGAITAIRGEGSSVRCDSVAAVGSLVYYVGSSGLYKIFVDVPTVVRTQRRRLRVVASSQESVRFEGRCLGFERNLIRSFMWSTVGVNMRPYGRAWVNRVISRRGQRGVERLK